MLEEEIIFPPEIKKALEALGNENRQKIISNLVKKEKLAFSDLLKITKLNSSTLNFHLRELMKGSLITNFYKKSETQKNYSYYELTSFGRDFLKSLGVY
ncbi:MAG: winged helix-turn-helix domain-containing protein [Promethearchaeota archaeon]